MFLLLFLLFGLCLGLFLLWHVPIVGLAYFGLIFLVFLMRLHPAVFWIALGAFIGFR